MNNQQQTTQQLLMVRPANFAYNKETAQNNVFQHQLGLNATELQKQVLKEFNQLVALLRAHAIDVYVVEDSPTPIKPDAVFPNNWISFHQDGSIVTYPMWGSNRRLERQESIIEQLEERFGFDKRFHLESWEEKGLFLEGTGSMILDRVNKICYACTSPRTHPDILKQFCTHYGYQSILFQSVDNLGQEIYHTNVMMALGKDFVVVGLDSIPNTQERQQLIQSFHQTGKTIIELSWEQIKAYAGNMLEVQNQAGKSFLVLSEQAYQALSIEQINCLEQFTTLLHSPIPTIETIGGGSVRCMLAEIFAPS